MEVDTVIIRNMVVVMAEDINRMAKDTEVDMEVSETTNLEAMVVTAGLNLEAMVVTAVLNLEAMAVLVVTNTEVMVGLEVTD